MEFVPLQPERVGFSFTFSTSRSAMLESSNRKKPRVSAKGELETVLYPQGNPMAPGAWELYLIHAPRDVRTASCNSRADATSRKSDFTMRHEQAGKSFWHTLGCYLIICSSQNSRSGPVVSKTISSLTVPYHSQINYLNWSKNYTKECSKQAVLML